MPGPARSHGRSPLRICIVCSGNICRSAMAEIVLRSLLERAGLTGHLVVDSAGTGDWHVGERADRRTVAALREAGYDGAAHRARVFDPAWLRQRDLVLVADHGHARHLRRMADDMPATAVRFLREFDPLAVAAGTLDVEDPYYGGPEDFARCLRDVEAACRGLITALPRLLAERDLRPDRLGESTA